MSSGCVNCIPDGAVTGGNRWKMPLQTLGNKQYYLGIFFKVRERWVIQLRAANRGLLRD